MWEGVCMELDSFLNEELGGLQILEVEIDDDDALVSVPDFIPVVKEITGDSHYANASLAGRLAKDSK
jgi:CYTH domain-containing protein